MNLVYLYVNLITQVVRIKYHYFTSGSLPFTGRVPVCQCSSVIVSILNLGPEVLRYDLNSEDTSAPSGLHTLPDPMHGHPSFFLTPFHVSTLETCRSLSSTLVSVLDLPPSTGLDLSVRLVTSGVSQSSTVVNPSMSARSPCAGLLGHSVVHCTVVPSFLCPFSSRSSVRWRLVYRNSFNREKRLGVKEKTPHSLLVEKKESPNNITGVLRKPSRDI